VDKIKMRKADICKCAGDWNSHDLCCNVLLTQED
jgi:hypothetical protein